MYNKVNKTAERRKGKKAMLVKATNPMTKLLNANLSGYVFRLEKFTPDQFKMFVDVDIWKNEADYNAATGKMQAIKVIYPDEYYSMPRYLTTYELVKIFRSSDKTATGFLQAVKDEIEI